jgi:hypothetical protein
MFLLCGKIPSQRSGAIPWQVQIAFAVTGISPAH